MFKEWKGHWICLPPGDVVFKIIEMEQNKIKDELKFDNDEYHISVVA